MFDEKSMTPTQENPQDVARENFNRWNEALQSRDPQEVAKLYMSECLFLPTRSPEFVKDVTGAEKYFEGFLRNNPEGTITDGESKFLGPDSLLHTGMYTFSLQNGGGERKDVAARFTFVWQRTSDGEWKILHHHSSVFNDANSIIPENFLESEITEEEKVSFKKDYMLRVGMYVFKEKEVDREKEVPARFTLVEKFNSKSNMWEVTHTHVSLVP